MSTISVLSPNASPARAALESVRDAARWVRETPAPRWEGSAARKAGFAGYVGASMIVWTFLGMSVAAALGQLVSAVG